MANGPGLMRVYFRRPISLLIAVLMTGFFTAGCQLLHTGNALTIERLAQVQLGDTKDRIRQLLGAPAEVAVYSRLEEEVWTYNHPYQSEGTVLLVFKSSDRLTSIFRVPFVTNFSVID